MQSYQKTLNENQLLKRTLQQQKLSHENTLKQLQTNHQMNKQLQQLLKVQQKRNNQLSSNLNKQTHRLQELSSQYQNQILEFKQLIDVKDRQIRQVHNVLMVTDYDMIRIRILNEVQLTHQQQLQQKISQIKRLEHNCHDYKHKYTINEDKISNLQIINKQLKEDVDEKSQIIHRKFDNQIKALYEKLQQERRSTSSLNRQYLAFKKKHEITIQHYEQILRQCQNTITKNMNNIQGYITPHQPQYKQDKGLKRKLENTQQQVNKLREQLRKCRTDYKKQLSDLQKINKQLIYEVQTKNDELLRKQNINKQQFITKQKQNSEKYSKITYSKNSEIQELKLQNGRLIKMLQQQKNKPSSYPYEEMEGLQSQNRNLKQQMKKLKQQLQQIHNKQQTFKVIDNKHDTQFNDAQWKKKLEYANQQIVKLLKQKIQLKQQINANKRK